MLVSSFCRHFAVASLGLGCSVSLPAAPVLAQSVVQNISETRPAAGRAMPLFLDKSHVADLVAARAALDGAAIAFEAAEAERAKDQRLMSETDVLARRAEQERVLAAEVRAKAEALSQRFAQELAQDTKAAETRAKPSARPPVQTVAAAESETVPSVGSAVQDERTAQAMRRAADALARARSTLDEADRNAAAGKAAAPGAWDRVKAEIADARRKAADAVESAQQALSAVPAAVADMASAGSAGAASTGSASAAADNPRKTLPPPYALGGTLR